jgi:hypothetical protein
VRKYLSLLCLVPLSAVSACKGKAGDAEADASTSTTVTSAEEDGGNVAAADGGARPQVWALDFTTPVYSAMAFPPKDPEKAKDDRQGVVRLGYIRRGQAVDIKPHVVKKANCPEGWFELVTGGYVCGKTVTTDPASKELANAPHPPFAEGALPYEYGLNLTNGTPMYRRRPLKKERKDLEKGLAIGKTNKDAGAPVQVSAEPDAPWYMKDNKGKRPQLTIDELRANEAGGLVVFRMVRGFYLGLDKELATQSGKFWRTTSGFLVPSDHVLVHKPATEFEGVRIGAPGEARHLPLGWVTNPQQWKYVLEEGGKVKRTEHVERFTIAQLTGKRQVAEDKAFWETTEGWWLREMDGTMTKPGPPPKDLAPGEKWIDVNLTTQTLIAFEGDKPVYATLVSTGRRNDEDKTQDHRTVQGEFRVREKHVAATMEDDGASDGPYSIQDVPWIMYFEGSYALHGAFWHSRFGHERSHGCVNMTPHDARQIFNWIGPTLPAGWHGVKGTKENPGTRVIVHE